MTPELMKRTEEQIALLSKNIGFVFQIKDLTDVAGIYAIQQNYNNIQLIENQTPIMQKFAIDTGKTSVLRYLNNITEEVALHALKNDRVNIHMLKYFDVQLEHLEIISYLSANCDLFLASPTNMVGDHIIEHLINLDPINVQYFKFPPVKSQVQAVKVLPKIWKKIMHIDQSALDLVDYELLDLFDAQHYYSKTNNSKAKMFLRMKYGDAIRNRTRPQ